MSCQHKGKIRVLLQGDMDPKGVTVLDLKKSHYFCAKCHERIPYPGRVTPEWVSRLVAGVPKEWLEARSKNVLKRVKVSLEEIKFVNPFGRDKK